MPPTTARPLPETTIDPGLKREIDALAASYGSVDEAEAAALASDVAAPLRGDPRWAEFCGLVASSFRDRGYVVVRGLEPDGGRSLLIASGALWGTPLPYGPGRIVKRFRMSPWTEELSHTIRAGDFHTDGNVSDVPPTATAMQCEREDPGAPEFAEQRVAHLPDLLDRLAAGAPEDVEALAYLTGAEAALGHESSSGVWRGRLVEGGEIRYHPHSLRAGAKRLGGDPAAVEPVIAAVHRAAVDVSVPFHTAPGDTVLVSNRAALHYRGACSVRFTRFPTEYEARSLFVLHVGHPA